jgi:glycosyltransferase involved in cell wall biosynthesis
MKTVLVYDHFIARGGAEKVSFQIADKVADCEIETAYADVQLFSKEIDSGQLKSFDLNFLKTLFPTLFLLWFYLFKYSVNNNNINLVLTGVFTPLVLFRHHKIANSVVYFHTFPSFVNSSFKQLKNKHGYIGATVFSLFTPFYLYLLKTSVKKSNRTFANSNSVQQRFKSIGIHSDVLYPPVDLAGFENQTDGNYFLSTSRLENNKRMALILEAFSKLPEFSLHVVGGGSLLSQFKTQYRHSNNIKFFGWLDDKAVKKQYNHCKALICLPENEYFGISPVEAMAAGKFVIGVAEGGLLETITNKKLGVLLEPPINSKALIAAVLQSTERVDLTSDKKFRQKHAEQFSEQQFIDILISNLK